MLRWVPDIVKFALPGFSNIIFPVKIVLFNIFIMEEHKKHEEHGAHHGMPEIPKVDLKSVNVNALKGGFGDVLEILKLNKVRIEAVAAREAEGITMALVYLIIGSFGAPLGGAILGYTILGTTFRTPILSALIGGVIASVMAAAVLYVSHLVAVRMFKGKAKLDQYVRVMGYAYIINVVGFLTVVPFLGAIAGIWLLVINYIVLTTVHKLDSTNAVLTIIITIIAFLVIGYLLAVLGMSAMMGGGFGGMGSVGSSNLNFSIR